MQKMRRIVSVLLAVVMLAGLLGTAMFTSAAAKPYKDVTSEDWFYENVKSLKKMKLMIGYHDGTFRPENNISLAESIAVAARIHAGYTQAPALKQGDVWYEVYTDYAVKNQLVVGLPSDVLAPATRLEFAHLLAKSLPTEGLEAINRVPDGAIPDVKGDEAIYLLYRAGVLIGADDEGNFLPERPITRAETAAIITRMADPSLRLKSGIFGIADVEVDGQGNVKNETAINADGASATVAAGTATEAGTTELALNVTKMETTGSNVQIEESQTLTSYDVHVDGIAADNTVPVIIELNALAKKGLNVGNLALYHVENGVTVAMTQVSSLAELDAHNEFYYDPATGKLTVAMATFSELAVVAETEALWGGSVADSFNGGVGTEDDPYIIASADQFAYFRAQVDGGNNFEDKYVKLIVDINLNNINFDPIGWGYDYDGYTTGGKTFNGIFDGQKHTIKGLYQNGWDLGYSYCMAGGGLFASVVDATIKNLTIDGANIVMECVDMGILVGLSQGNCTYENIIIRNSKIANYQRATGGVVGEVSPKFDGNEAQESVHTFTNVTVEPTVVVGSLWGDFDAPCGGVIGGYWDDSNNTTVKMNDVTVACRMDVYNDVTSTYQWYAYRRAGMLIGNTDQPPADGKNAKTATAGFLTCENVKVYYGNWANYHYCEFTNHNSSWPWVRVEAGENCSAYSNPRYGVPNDAEGNKVVDADHEHQSGDEHMAEIPFNQLYGGGQGVYGATEHEGVDFIQYTITYMYDVDTVIGIKYVTEDESTSSVSVANADYADKALELSGNEEFASWVNAGSSKVTHIPENNEKDIILYPSYEAVHTARFVDQQGNVLASGTFTKNSYNHIKNMVVEGLPVPKDCTFDYWEVRYTLNGSRKTATLASYRFDNGVDVTIYPIYKYSGAANLIPVDEDADGATDYYVVGGFNNGTGVTLVDIPSHVNGLPITGINANSFSSYEHLHSVVIPITIENVGEHILPGSWSLWDKGEDVTLYYEGSYEQWVELEKTFNGNWEKGVGKGSRIFFMNGTGKVDPSQGYLQASHKTNLIGTPQSVTWNLSTVTASLKTEYTGKCTCKVTGCTGNIRPDEIYWRDVTVE